MNQIAAPVVATGTSLEVLAPCLPYGIEVEMLNTDFSYTSGERGQLVALNAHNDHRARARWADGSLAWLPVREMLPVLRPFSALCDPLPDGAVPAVEVAKLILDLNLNHCEDGYLAGISARMDADFDCSVYLPNEDWSCVTIYNDWLIKAHEAMTPPAAYDYLRRAHFAVGLEPHQFITK